MNDCSSKADPCRYKGDYAAFDQIASEELREPPVADEILNHSSFCSSFHLDMAGIDVLNVSDYLGSLKNSIGVYYLWIDSGERCEEHGTHKMICVYIGKGDARIRVEKHIKDKWPKDEQFFVSFFECSNRIAKYVEQLFLDTYKFYLNRNEMNGQEYLYGFWDDHRYENGTDTQRLGDILVERLYQEIP
jgi:hypothetical protein